MAKENKQSWFKRHKVLTVLGGLILLGVIISVATGGSGSDKTKTSTAPGAAPSSSNKQSEAAKIGQTANDGKFQFVVNSIKCGESSVADSSGYLTKAAQGQFCLLDLTVKNIGNEAQTLDSSSQYLFNAAGQKYSADSSASLYANPSGSTFLNSINPGNTATGKFVFDVPKDQTPVTAELHDSALSGGIKVSLQ